MCLHHLQLGLFEGRFVRDNVVFVMEGMKQQELISLRPTTHQSTRLTKRSKTKQNV